MPISTMIARPVTSMVVRPMLSFTDSEIPRKFTSATKAMNSSATGMIGDIEELAEVVAGERPARVAADVMPDAITAKATMNVKNGRPKAPCTYTAAPPACGYFVTSSAYANAVKMARTSASVNADQIATTDLARDLARPGRRSPRRARRRSRR